MALGRPSLFRGPISNGLVVAIPITIVAGSVGVHVFWPDATTAGTFTLEFTSMSSDEAPLSSGGAGTMQPGMGTAVLAGPSAFWEDSGETIPSIPGGAAGSFLLNFSNIRQQRARLMFTATAASNLDVRPGITDV